MNRTLLAALVIIAAACDSTATGRLGPASGALVALGSDGTIFWVDATDPDSILGDVRLRGGVGTTNPFVTMSYRLATGALYGRAADAGMFTVDLEGGLANQLGAAVQFPGATVYASAFSPTSDRWRIVTDRQDNVLLHPETGLGTSNGPLNNTSVIGAIAYAQTGASTWTVYGIDNTNKQLVRLGGLDGVPSPNSGIIEIAGGLGLGTDTVSAGGMAVSTAGLAYAAIELSSDHVTKLYRINLATGAATLVGRLGTGVPVRAITFAP